MKLLIILLCLSSWSSGENNDFNPETLSNSTDANKDMYVIHAMVYQVGIITNKSEEGAANASMAGDQEAVTFYLTNGSNIDLSDIPKPLITNVTAQSLIGIAPTHGLTTENATEKTYVPWNNLAHLASLQEPISEKPRISRNVALNNEDAHRSSYDYSTSTKNSESDLDYLKSLHKKSLDSKEESKGNIFKETETPVKIVKGTSIIPQEASVKSIVIPPLLTLNNNFSEIPVPIPNTSVVHYAKVNTLVHMP